MNWLVLYTKPNYELRVAKGINNLGINAYCPVFTKVKQYSDRKKKIQKPLLPSYVLVQLSEEDRPKVFSVPGVVRYLFWLGRPAVVREEEIKLLKLNLKGIFDEVKISKLSIGKEYIISSGPLRSQSAKVIEILKNKLRLELPSLGFFVSLSRAVT
tara:strand:+ start:265 stop:732 length:468 start_codon:yes stop_codon:yes gene_type:complete